jgi:hypothetical protein
MMDNSKEGNNEEEVSKNNQKLESDKLNDSKVENSSESMLNEIRKDLETPIITPFEVNEEEINSWIEQLRVYKKTVPPEKIKKGQKNLSLARDIKEDK